MPEAATLLESFLARLTLALMPAARRDVKARFWIAMLGRWLARLVERVANLERRVARGETVARAARSPRPPKVVTETAEPAADAVVPRASGSWPRLPRAWGWLGKFAGEAVPLGDDLVALVESAPMRALLLAAPQLRAPLRALLEALMVVTVPEAVAAPERPRRRRTRRRVLRWVETPVPDSQADTLQVIYRPKWV